MNPATKPILEAASEFLWSDELQSSLDSFSTNHAPLFADATGVEGEQKLEWTQAHLDFQQLFEFQLEQFVATQSFSQAEFVAACQDALDNGDWANCKGLVEVVLSMSTYEYFVRMMVAAPLFASTLSHRSSTEFTTPNDKRVVEHSALFQVANQGGGTLVNSLASFLMFRHNRPV